MREDLFEEMYQLEDSYWWHVSKRNLVRRLTSQHVGRGKNQIYMDIGCGTGRLIAEVRDWKRWKKIVGLDGSATALSFCKKRGKADFIQTDFEKTLPVNNNSVDVITSLDVVEHVAGDQRLIKEFYRILKPGGVVMVAVPAHQWLWTYWDDMLGHKRRYETVEVKDKFEKAGLDVEKISYFYSYLLPMALAFRVLKSIFPKWKKSSDFVELPEWANQMLLRLSSWEIKLISKMNVPLGLSVVCVARKPVNRKSR